jgi:hypothetical protein
VRAAIACLRCPADKDSREEQTTITKDSEDPGILVADRKNFNKNNAGHSNKRYDEELPW